MDKRKRGELRQRAEERLASEADPLVENSDDALRAALHELRTHQIELELQNEELRRVQEELLETHGKFVDLYDFAPVGYLTVSADGLILEANLTASEMFGFPRTRLIEQPLSAFVFRQDQDILYRCRKSLLQSKKAQICELRIQRNDGSLFFASLKSVVTPEVDGSSGRFRAIITDISEQKLADEKIQREKNKAQSYLDVAAVMILILNRKGEIATINQYGGKILHVTENEALGKNWFEHFVPKRAVDKVKGIFDRIIDGESAQVTYIENPVLTGDGVERTFAFHHTVLKDENGDITGILSSGDDITDRKNAEEQLKASSEAIKLFAYSIAHDLKNPVIALHLLTKILHEKHGASLDEKGRNFCLRILQSSGEIVEIINKLTTYIESRENPLFLEKVSIDEVTQIIHDEFEAQFSQRKITFAAPTTTREAIICDRLSLLRVLRNLVENALKHGGGRLSHIECMYKKSDDFHILGISDNGKGMEEAISKDMFGLFKRNAATSETQGVGLGLAIVKEIAEKHGGQAWSEPGSKIGISFCISIPVIN